jgi:hypothetical protein
LQEARIYIQKNQKQLILPKKPRTRTQEITYLILQTIKKHHNLIILFLIALFFVISYFISELFPFFIILTLLSFFSRIFFIKSRLPLDFTFTFFGAYVIIHSMGIVYAFVFIFIADMMPNILVEKAINPLGMVNYFSYVIIFGITVSCICRIRSALCRHGFCFPLQHHGHNHTDLPWDYQ